MFCSTYDQILGIYGGNMLGVRSVSGLAFYDWETAELVRRIEITPKLVSAQLLETVTILAKQMWKRKRSSYECGKFLICKYQGL